MMSNSIPMRSPLQNVARMILQIEPILLAITLFAFWHHSPPIRDNWVGLIVLFPIMCSLRWVAYGRFFTKSALIFWMFIFMVLTAFNYEYAPYQRSHYWVLVCRPIAGIWLVVYLGEVARLHSLRPIIINTVLLALIIGFLALTATQWTTKSDLFQGIIALIPRPDYRTWLPDMMLSFNPNEIAGAIAWVLPAMVVFSLNRNLSNWIRYLAAIGAIILLLALMFGQSRFAIGGIVLALGFIILKLLAQSKRTLMIASIGLCTLILFEASIVLNVFSSIDPEQDTLSLNSRDEQTASTRFDIWGRGIQMAVDYPLTGVGMSMYRSAVRTEDYVIPYFEQQNWGPPHAHNQWVQIAADLGFLGLTIYIIWHSLAFSILWKRWKEPDENVKYFVVAVAGGFIAYAGYAIGDAITLWDRFHFLLWWFFGMIAALDHFVRFHRDKF